jgi:transcriptional regulator GlxA family with amidase domain
VAEFVSHSSLLPSDWTPQDGSVAPRPRTVIVVAFPDVQALDVVGPLEVFAMANRYGAAPAYTTALVSASGQPVTTSSGLLLGTERVSRRDSIDTLLVAGGTGTAAAMADDRLIAWLRTAAASARRVTSVCSGAFLLAQAGLLDGRRVTTHWSACDALARLFPSVEVDADPIYVRDGDVWTSAGVTAGMDLALALVEHDHGGELALAVARPAGAVHASTRWAVPVQCPVGRPAGRA